MKRGFAILVALGILGAFGWHVYRKVTAAAEGPGAPRRQAAVAVEVTPVRKMTIRDVGEFTGSLLPRSQFTVAPKVPGRLEKLLVNIGDSVQRDDLIAVLDSQEYAQQVEEARAALEVAKANVAESSSALDVAKREFERATALREKKIASESELDEAEARYKACDAKYNVSLAQVAQNDAGLKAAEVRLSYTQIRASWEDGQGARVIGERFMDEGTMLRANDAIVSVLDVDSLIAVMHVIERDYVKVHVGQKAAIATDAYPDRQFSGTVARIAPLLRETSRQARVELDVPNADHALKPGMFVRVQIELERRDDATVVPASALARRNGQQGVFVANTQRMDVQFVPTTVGIVNGELAEVVEPPLEGPVVILGHHLLEDGSAIILAPASPEASPAGAAGPQTAAGAQAAPAPQQVATPQTGAAEGGPGQTGARP